MFYFRSSKNMLRSIIFFQNYRSNILYSNEAIVKVWTSDERITISDPEGVQRVRSNLRPHVVFECPMKMK